jgi:hypothetical protein
LVQPRSEKMGICQQKQLRSAVVCSAAQRKLWNLQTKGTVIDRVLLCHAAKILKLANNESPIDCILSCPAVKLLPKHKTPID